MQKTTWITVSYPIKTVENAISCSTKFLNKHGNEWAVCMQDRKLMAKLSEWGCDSHRNHKNCLTNMYNKFKVKHKKAAVEKELLSTIEGIYTQF